MQCGVCQLTADKGLLKFLDGRTKMMPELTHSSRVKEGIRKKKSELCLIVALAVID